MLLALCCFIGCDNSTNSGVNNGNDENVNTGNNENSNNGTTEETTDWWIGTWKSQVYETTLPTSKEINFYYLFEIKYSNSDERRTFICSIIDNDSNVIAISYVKDITEIKEIIKTFLEMKFSEEERHQRRINLIDTYGEM